MWLVLLLGMMILSCRPEGNNENGSQAASPNSPAVNNIGSGQAAAPVNPGNSPLVTILTADFWVFEHYVIPEDQAGGWANKGRWYQFNPDGSFESGHWEELTGNGSWRLEKREGKQILIIDSTIDMEDSEWEIDMNAEQDAMSWVGTENYKRTSHMLKVISLLSRPTKKQFGVEE